MIGIGKMVETAVVDQSRPEAKEDNENHLWTSLVGGCVPANVPRGFFTFGSRPAVVPPFLGPNGLWIGPIWESSGRQAIFSWVFRSQSIAYSDKSSLFENGGHLSDGCALISRMAWGTLFCRAANVFCPLEDRPPNRTPYCLSCDQVVPSF